MELMEQVVIQDSKVIEDSLDTQVFKVLKVSTEPLDTQDIKVILDHQVILEL